MFTYNAILINISSMVLVHSLVVVSIYQLRKFTVIHILIQYTAYALRVSTDNAVLYFIDIPT